MTDIENKVETWTATSSPIESTPFQTKRAFVKMTRKTPHLARNTTLGASISQVRTLFL